jgi:PIN domain nuclease of toxin-antitoxin system
MMVLDASVLLAFLFQEEGSPAVAAALGRSCMSAVNLSELLGLFARDGKDTRIVAGWLRQLPLEIVPFDREEAAEAAALRSQTDRYGLSLGDRACLSLGLARGLPVLTADRVWQTIGLPLDIRLIR